MLNLKEICSMQRELDKTLDNKRERTILDILTSAKAELIEWNELVEKNREDMKELIRKFNLIKKHWESEILI